MKKLTQAQIKLRNIQNVLKKPLRNMQNIQPRKIECIPYLKFITIHYNISDRYTIDTNDILEILFLMNINVLLVY